MKITVNVGEKRSFPMGEAYKVSTPHISATWEWEIQDLNTIEKIKDSTEKVFNDLQEIVDSHMKMLEERHKKPDQEHEMDGVKYRLMSGKWEYQDKEGIWKQGIRPT